MNKKELRKSMRNKRRALTPAQQKNAQHQLAKSLSSNLSLRLRQRWAMYFANDGEIDPAKWRRLLLKRRRETFLPVLHPVYHNRLWFVRFTQATPMRRNRYGIWEPQLAKAERVATWTLNVIALPLVAFDSKGARLGMGGGFYDRSLAAARVRVRKPLFIGFAHHFQEVDHLPTEEWDIPLDGITTDKGAKTFDRQA